MSPPFQRGRRAKQDDIHMVDPGNAGTLTVTKTPAICEFVTTAAQTRTIADPTGTGDFLTLTLLEDGGDCTITFVSAYDAAENTVLVFADAQDTARFVSIDDSGDESATSTYAWSIVSLQKKVGEAVRYGDNAEVTYGDAPDYKEFWNGTYQQSGPTVGVWSRATPNIHDPSVASRFHDDFIRLDTSLDWQETSDGTPGFAITDSDTLSGGRCTLSTQPSSPQDNDEVYVSTKNQNWVFLDGKKLWFEVNLELTEINVDDANIIVGLSDTVGANFLLDAGAGPATSYDGCVFFKVDGGTVWQFETSNAGTQATLTDAGSFASATTQTLGFYFDGVSTTSTITPYVNGVAGTAQNITLSGLQAMHFVFGVKCGAISQIETLVMDAVTIIQLR